MEPALGESCLSGQRRGPAAPGEDRVLSLDHKSLHISATNSNNQGSKPGIPRVDTAPHGVETPTTLVAHWLGLMEPARGDGCLSCRGRGCAAQGRVRSHPRVRNPSMSLQLQQTGNRDGDPTGRYRPTQCGNPTQGTPLSIGVREASGPHPMGVRSSASS